MTGPIAASCAHEPFCRGQILRGNCRPANHDDQGTNCRSARGNRDAAGAQRRESIQNSRLSKCRALDRSFRRQFYRSAKSGDAGKDPWYRESNRGKHAGSFQFGEIAAEAEQLRSDLAAHNDALQVSVAGSFRRRKEIVRDLDFIVASKSPDTITEFFCAHPFVEGLIARGPTKTS